ncbi:ACP phosphodiesterase [Elongatibacter sediminis]|uniref:ACP phosphodiesterase n=1 Tax=Elongatibacter sediminis TaxID=3119006 RepID=A0AAW9RIG5_9GAMM
MADQARNAPERAFVRSSFAVNGTPPPFDSGIVPAMNFLAHLWLAGEDEGLRLGAMLGDFKRGRPDNLNLPLPVERGVLLHRFIDQHVDALPEVARLREEFDAPFRRYSGIILDLAFDHELARRWTEFSPTPLTRFDFEVRQLLSRNEALLPEDLQVFMRYADRRGLFAAYREESEILHSLRGVGRRLSRANPLHRVDEIWPQMRDRFRTGFEQVFPIVRDAVDQWLEESGETRQTA